MQFIPWHTDSNFAETANEPLLPLPEHFVLNAYPNPFNSTVRLTLIPAEVQIVNVKLYDVLGREVAEVWRGPLPFRKEINFDASRLSSGIYFVRVADTISRKQMATRKLVLLK